MDRFHTGAAEPSQVRQAAEAAAPPDCDSARSALLARLHQTVRDGGGATAFREAARGCASLLRQQFDAGASASLLVHGRAQFVDELLRAAWEQHFSPRDPLTLVAVGGYGRGELHPHSDIDLMLLAGGWRMSADIRARIQRFVTFLWDTGLEVGHSVRSVRECLVQARGDITVATNLLESRLLCGAPELYDKMRKTCGGGKAWPSAAFFEAKRAEQEQRHLKAGDTGYRLEPNIKESPGGLRDLQTIGWVAKRHFGAASLDELVNHGFLMPAEHAALLEAQEFLWKVRAALHLLTGRREDRLLFDHQRALAAMFGYHDAASLAVEQFMQRYYRTVKEVQRLNEMLLQHFAETLLLKDQLGQAMPLNSRFQTRSGWLEARHEHVFQRQPFAMLELFLLRQQHPDILGVRAATLRQLHACLPRIDAIFRNDLRARSLFMEILRQPHGQTHALRAMNRHGVLGAYLPAFGRVEGLMQFDLFHIYTVDEHILHVLRNVRRSLLPAHAAESPLAARVAQELPKPELAYLAALFHDIAKGRGGDHSTLGETEAEDFCQRHGLSRYDTRLVCWLVRHHLLMSATAQREDISDGGVVAHFARTVSDRTHLNYLYVLTVADMRGTNPEIWNAWKAALLADLYSSTLRALRRGLENPLDKEELLASLRASAHQKSVDGGLSSGQVEAVWAEFTEEYFLRHQPHEIAWHTRLLAESGAPGRILCALRADSLRGATLVFLHAPGGGRASGEVFARATAALEKLALSIQDARILTTASGNSLHSLAVLDASGQAVADAAALHDIQNALDKALSGSTPPALVSRPLPRTHKPFAQPSVLNFSEDTIRQRSVLELITPDRPGLLSRVARAFLGCGVRLVNARVLTLGARAEDVFFITAGEGGPVSEGAIACLRSSLHAALDQPASATTAP
jgi:[protein-PII] uridylyltransferase